MSTADNVRNNLDIIHARGTISWNKLAKGTGITKRALLNFRQGGDIRTGTLDAMANALGIKPTTLIKPMRKENE